MSSRKEMGLAFCAGTGLVALATGQLGTLCAAIGLGMAARKMTAHTLRGQNEDLFREAEDELRDELKSLDKDERDSDAGQELKAKLRNLREYREAKDSEADTIGNLAGIGVFADPLIGGLAACAAGRALSNRRQRVAAAKEHYKRTYCKRVRHKSLPERTEEPETAELEMVEVSEVLAPELKI